MSRSGSEVRELFTLWCSFRWSACLGILMVVVSFGDVAFTLLNVGRFGIGGEVNPIARLLIEGGQLATLLWVLLSILSAFLVYLPLISYWLTLPADRRQGRMATLISAVLAVRITMVLYSMMIYYYSGTQDTLSAMLMVGIVLMFLLRSVLKHEGSLGLTNIRYALGSVWKSLRSIFSRSSSDSGRSSATVGNRRQRKPDEELATASEGMKRKRNVKRIAVLLVALFAVPVSVLVLMQFVVNASGITSIGTDIVPIEDRTSGTVFMVGFVLAIACVALLVYILFTLMDELTKR